MSVSPHDVYVSGKQDLIVRRIKWITTGAVFTLRPSFVMPYMIARTDAVEKALSLRQWRVPFDALAYVFGRDAMFWYRVWLAFGCPSLLGTTVKDPHQVPRDLARHHRQRTPGSMGHGAAVELSPVWRTPTAGLAIGVWLYYHFTLSYRAETSWK